MTSVSEKWRLLIHNLQRYLTKFRFFSLVSFIEVLPNTTGSAAIILQRSMSAHFCGKIPLQTCIQILSGEGAPQQLGFQPLFWTGNASAGVFWWRWCEPVPPPWFSAGSAVRHGTSHLLGSRLNHLISYSAQSHTSINVLGVPAEQCCKVS